MNSENELKAYNVNHACETNKMFDWTLNDATPAALKDYLCGEWRAIGLMSDEAGSIFNGHAFLKSCHLLINYGMVQFLLIGKMDRRL